MITISGYQILEEIHESSRSLVYRGRRDRDAQPVILKVLKQEYPTPEAIAKYKLEYEITRQLKIEGVVKAYALENYQNSLVMILEDFGADSLKILMKPREFALEEFLELAIQMADILGEIHQQNVIHKDINPSNIVFNQDRGQVKIIDFGIATFLSRENPSVRNPNVLEGTLAYMSPEQTGRMNRAMDYRTDFYSLGATFYEILTHQLPFNTSDAMELIHCHIAKQPVPPQILKGGESCPKAVSDIVIKLLAKTAEDRYQSAYGLKVDLELCLTQLKNKGEINTFVLGKHDVSGKFQIPQKLYGREREVETLLAAFERVAGGTGEQGSKRKIFNSQSPVSNPKSKVEMMLVSGYSGIGKSALVQEIYKPITQRKGYFISGKFDQFQRNIPYVSLIQAFQELIRQLLTESEAEVARWRSQLLTILGVNGQIIADVIPEVELIIGKQPDVAFLGSTESQNRFNLVFQNFIGVFTKPEHPLAIFIDDLQWADSASLKLIQLLVTEPNSQNLFLIGAYRDNEVSAAHPLILTLDEIKKTGVIIDRISLSPLDLTHVNQLISDTLNCEKEKSKPLAELVLQKTNGNPFFMNEFLKSLYAEGLLKFNFSLGIWQWNNEQIQAVRIADNVVELMAGKIQKLSDQTQQVLKLAACIGNRFDLKTLSLVYEKSPVETAKQIWQAVISGLILPIGDDYKFLMIREDWELETHISQSSISYKFLHDRVQQAAYSLIPVERKQVVHLQVGQLLLKTTPQETIEEKIFDIVNQLNFGVELISDRQDRDALARLNLIAGKKAMTSAAYQPALNYLKIGIDCLDVNAWTTQYELTLSLYVEAAEAALLSTEFEQMETLVEVVLKQAKALLDKVKVYEVKLQSSIAQNKLLEAVQTALQVLKLLGITFPKKPRKIDTLLGLLRTKLAIAFKGIDNLIDLPEMTAPDKLAAMRILSSVTSAVYIAAPELFPLIVFKQVNLSIKYGNASVSAFGYSGYGIILCGVVGDIDSGYQVGELALSLLERFNAKELKARTFMVVYDFIKHWKKHVRETLQPAQEAYQIGLETGDLEFAALSAFLYSYSSFSIGKKLTLLEKEMAAYSKAIAQLRQETTLNFNEMFRQTVLNLMGKAENPSHLSGEAYNEEIKLPLHLAANDRTAIFRLYFNKLFLCYMFGEYDRSGENAVIAEQYLDGGTASILIPLFHFYDSLARLAIFPNASKLEQKRIFSKVTANQNKMKKWAHYAPMNHLHRFYLVEAEQLRIRGEDAKAIDCYDRAIELAKENEYINEEALAYELAAKFYLAKNKDKIARFYMLDARYYYQLWGATAKVKDLELRYPQLLTKTSEVIQINTHSTQTSTFSTALDLATVIKALQVLSGEIVLDKLLASLMKITIENAGAQKGFLILETKGELLIEAEGSVEGDNVKVLQSIPLETGNGALIPAAIINYVARTKESVVLNDATVEGKFTSDRYIIQNQPKSILCTSLLNQGKLTGILYLENNLTTGAFTPDRLEILNLLSSQAAISIETARLYKNMAELNTAYAHFVPREFLQFLGKESIVDVKLGDQVQKEMSVLFSDIRAFTTLSETMTPKENFKFINSYLSRMEPAIIENNGFIDKYIGDAIMALFSGSADDAVKAGIAMLHKLAGYNQHRQRSGYMPIQIGIGIHTGSLMLGTVGGKNRMDSTVISDAVNLASRLQDMTKDYGVSLLISDQTFFELRDSAMYAFRLIDRVQVKGKLIAVTVYEIFDADPPEILEAKLFTKTIFEEGLLLYNQRKLREAKQLFQLCLRQNPTDKVAEIYVKRCQQLPR